MNKLPAMNKLHNRKDLVSNRRHLRNNMVQAEIILWSRLKGKALLGLKFRRQHSVGNYILDFYCPLLKLGIELDGQTHENSFDYDNKRQVYIESLGIRILRFNNIDIYNGLELVLEEIARQSRLYHSGLSATPPY